MRLIALLTAGSLLAATISPDQQWWLQALGPEAGQATGGESVVVAVIDTGIDTSHPDLASVVIGGADFSSVGTPDGRTPVGDSSFHGTMVASLIAGQGLVTGGVIGVAPAAKLLSVSVGLGVPGSDTDAQIAAAVTWAVDAGADIINLSLSRNAQTWPASWDAAFLHAFENDVVIVAASGNELTGNALPGAPATIPGVISVTGVDQDFVSQPVAGASGYEVSISAPGKNMFGSYPGDEIAGWSGSSAAAPIVTGVIALMMQKDPEATANDIIFRLISTARDMGQQGFDADYGFGLIDASLALESSLTSSTNPLGSLEYWMSLYRASSFDEAAAVDLVSPESPEPLRPQSALADPPESFDVQAPWYINPLLYFLLSLVALSFWFALRYKRKAD